MVPGPRKVLTKYSLQSDGQSDMTVSSSGRAWVSALLDSQLQSEHESPEGASKPVSHSFLPQKAFEDESCYKGAPEVEAVSAG